MKTTKYALAVALGLIALMAPKGVRADDIVSVTISNLTFAGKNACGPDGSGTGTSTCTETLNAFFQWDNTSDSYVNGSLTTAVTGAVSPSTLAPFQLIGFIPDTVRLENTFSGIAEGSITVDIFDSGTLTPGLYVLTSSIPPPQVPQTVLANFSCGAVDVAPVCNADFQGSPNLATVGTVVVAEATVADPPTVILFGTGLLCLIGMTMFRKRLA